MTTDHLQFKHKTHIPIPALIFPCISSHNVIMFLRLDSPLSDQPESLAPIIPIAPAPPTPEMSNGHIPESFTPPVPQKLEIGSLVEIGMLVFRVKSVDDTAKEITLKLAGMVKPSNSDVEEMVRKIQEQQSQVAVKTEEIAKHILTPTGALKEVLATSDLGLKSSPKKVIVPHNFRKHNASE